MAELDSVTRRVVSIISAGVRQAYGHGPEPDDSHLYCPACKGDGCERCGFTGDAPE